MTRDPEYGTTQSGVNYCRFTVACQRRFKNANGGYDADFIGCVAWRQTADFVHRYFITGNRIGVTGSIQTRTYDAQDGSRRYVTEVVADNVEFVAPRSDGESRQPAPADEPPRQQRTGTSDISDFTEVDDDELPF